MQILFQWLRIVGKVARRLAVQHGVFHAQLVEQLGKNDAAHGVDGIYANAEMSVANSLSIHQVETHHIVDVPLVGLVAVDVAPQIVNVGIAEIFFLGNAEHLGTIAGGEKLAFVVEQL